MGTSVKLDEKYNDLQYISVNNKNICVQKIGSGEEVIVLLHGGGVSAPIMEYRGLTKLLSEKYTCFSIEFLGYGFSEGTQIPRTIENIVDELHCVIGQIGCKQFTLIAHSIAGVYALYYLNKYKNDVASFVGIDSSVPKQNDFVNVEKATVVSWYVINFLSKVGIMKLISKFGDTFVPKINGITWTKEERILLKEMFLESCTNKTVLNEFKNITKNFEKARNLSYPPNIPVLFILATGTLKQIKPWKEIHQYIIGDKVNSKIVFLEGTHFLHYKCSEQIVEELEVWKSEILSSCIRR